MGPEPDSPPDALDAIAGLADGVRRTLYRFVAAQPGPVGKDDAAAHAEISRSLAAYHLVHMFSHGYDYTCTDGEKCSYNAPDISGDMSWVSVGIPIAIVLLAITLIFSVMNVRLLERGTEAD